MQLKFSSFSVIFFLLLPALTQARLGETEQESKARYGRIVSNPHPNRVPSLLKDASYLTYEYNGWRIYSAFLNGHAVRMGYTKLPQKGRSQVIHQDEINAILQAEAHNGTWEKITKKSFFTKYTKGDMIFQSAQTRLLNTNGSRAYLTPGHMNLYIDAPEAVLWEHTITDEEEQQRKANIPSF